MPDLLLQLSKAPVPRLGHRAALAPRLAQQERLRAGGAGASGGINKQRDGARVGDSHCSRDIHNRSSPKLPELVQAIH